MGVCPRVGTGFFPYPQWVVPSRMSLPLRARSAMAVVLAAGFIFGGVGGLSPISADPIDRIQSQQRENNADLNEVEFMLGGAKKKVRKALAAASRAQESLNDAKTELKRARNSARRSAAYAERLRVEAAYAQSEYVLGVRAKNRIEARLESQRNDMDNVARAFYQQGPLSEVEVLLDSKSPADFTSRLVAVDYISREQQGVEQSLMVTQADVNNQEVKLRQLSTKASSAHTKAQKQLTRARAAVTEAETQHAKVVQLRQEKRKALNKARKFSNQVKVRYQKLKVEQRRLKVAAQKAVAAARRAAAQSNSSATSPTGDLVWPVPGYQKSGSVGPRVHPIYGYNSCHTGIDIGSPSGTSVKASGAGTVAAITNGGPYGRAVLLVHADGLTTFYAHLSGESVNVGQSVDAGQEVGKVGSTGWSTGPHLHYEIRINGTPYDPMGWFGGARNQVGCSA